MADRQGMCPNIGNCAAADQRRRIPLAAAPGQRCPDCGRVLLEVPAGTVPPPPAPGRRWLARAAAAGGVLAMLALGAPLLVARTAPGPGEAPAAPAAAPAGPVRVALTLAGSNTIGARLAPAWAAGLLMRKGYGAITRTVLRPEEVMVSGRPPGGGPAQGIVIRAHGSSTGFTALADGSADMAMASRPVSDAEAKALTALGDLRAPGNEHVVGLDGVAVIVNAANPVGALSMGQLADLFSGRARSWAAVGGPDLPVSLYARDDRSGTFDTFRALVLGSTPLAATARRLEDSAALAAAVAAEPGAVGFVGLPYVGGAKAVAIADGGDPGGRTAIPPTRFSVATEDYPLSRRLFLYGAAQPSPLAADYLAFALSPEGQAIASESGYVALTLEGAPAATAGAPPDAAPADYAALTADAVRLSTNLRFRPGSSDFDTKALRDIDRVVDFVAEHRAPAEVILLGFTDDTGTPETNRLLSQQRAEVVARALQQRGLGAPQAVGLGPILPVASNQTPDGRNRNRRVEVWIRAVR